MKQHFFLFILFFACMTIHAQDYQALASQHETEADEFAKKSYKRKDAYCAYLSAYITKLELNVTIISMLYWSKQKKWWMRKKSL